MPSSTLYRYGWVPDLPSRHDAKYAYAAPLIALPDSIDLRSGFPDPYDQQTIGSCTANALAGAVQYMLRKENQPDVMPSRLFIYYNERLKEHTVNSDSGASLRDGMYSLAHQGYCPETDWPYLINQFTRKPLTKCYKEALAHTITSYHRVSRSLNKMKTCLAQGYPIVFGFTVYQSTEDAMVGSGHVEMPTDTSNYLGGHACVLCGYSESDQWFLCRNSWGLVGLQGYFTLPFAYLMDENLSDDFWTIRITN